MKSFKFLHFGDLHLDAPFSSLGVDNYKSSQRRNDLKIVFDRIISLAKDEKVDAIFICGDFFEHEYVSKSTIHFVNEKFKSIEHINIFIIPGNHDPLILNSYYKIFKFSDNVIILCEENPYVRLDTLGVVIHGIGFNNFYQENSITYNIKPANFDDINVLLVHGTVDLNFSNKLYNSMNSENLSSLGMDYIALGHFHNRIDNVGNKGVIYNPGSPEPLGFDELGVHGVYIGNIVKEDNAADCKLEVNFTKTNEKTYEIADVELDGCFSDEQIIEKITSVLGDRDLLTYCIKINLSGFVEKDFNINVDFITNYFRDKVFFMKITDKTSPSYDLEMLKKEIGLRGLFVRKVLQKISQTEDEFERNILKKALNYGLLALDEQFRI